MCMDSNIINGLFSLAGVCLGALLTYLLNRDKKREEKLRHRVEVLADQVAGYWSLEKFYAKQLAEWEGKPETTICKEYRQKAQESCGIYPKMTAKEAQEYKE